MNKQQGAEPGDRLVKPGTKWLVDRGLITIVRIAAVNKVVVEDEEGAHHTVRPGELRRIDSADAKPANLPAASCVTDEDWERARSLQADIEATAGDGEITAAIAHELARKWSVSRATVCRRIRRYRRDLSLLALVDRAPGPLPGSALIAEEIEHIISEVARRWWHQTENATISEIEPEVQAGVYSPRDQVSLPGNHSSTAADIQGRSRQFLWGCTGRAEGANPPHARQLQGRRSLERCADRSYCRRCFRD